MYKPTLRWHVRISAVNIPVAKYIRPEGPRTKVHINVVDAVYICRSYSTYINFKIKVLVWHVAVGLMSVNVNGLYWFAIIILYCYCNKLFYLDLLFY